MPTTPEFVTYPIFQVTWFSEMSGQRPPHHHITTGRGSWRGKGPPLACNHINVDIRSHLYAHTRNHMKTHMFKLLGKMKIAIWGPKTGFLNLSLKQTWYLGYGYSYSRARHTNNYPKTAQNAKREKKWRKTKNKWRINNFVYKPYKSNEKRIKS